MTKKVIRTEAAIQKQIVQANEKLEKLRTVLAGAIDHVESIAGEKKEIAVAAFTGDAESQKKL